jgi:hypothetical protein
MTTEYATNQNGKPTPEYGAHSNAMRRCTCPDDPNFKHYGGRGIKFLFTSFRQFLADIGRRGGKTAIRQGAVQHPPHRQRRAL